MGPITRTAALAIIFEISIVLPVGGTEELTDTPPPLAIQIGEHRRCRLCQSHLPIRPRSDAVILGNEPGLPRAHFPTFLAVLPRLSGIPKRPNRSARTGS